MTEERIEFITIREDFSEYEAENGQILRVKSVVTEIINRMEDDKKGGGLKFSTISNVSTPIKIDTSNMKLVTDASQVTQDDVLNELKFKPIREIVNIYETKNALILVIPHMQQIFLTNKKDESNAPHLRYLLATDVNIIEKIPPSFSPKF